MALVNRNFMQFSKEKREKEEEKPDGNVLLRMEKNQAENC